MFILTSTKPVTFTTTHVIDGSKATAEFMSSMRKSLALCKDVETNLNKYFHGLTELDPAKQHFDWSPRVPVITKPTAHSAVQFEMYNWLLVLAQIKMSSVLQCKSELQIVNYLREALGILSYMRSAFLEFYDLQPVKSVCEGFVNAMITLMIDQQDAFSNQNFKVPIGVLSSTTLLSTEQLKPTGQIQDKLLNATAAVTCCIQTARKLWLMHESQSEVLIELQKIKKFDFTPEICQTITQRYAALADKLLTEVNQATHDGAPVNVTGNGFVEIEFRLRQL